MWIQVPEINQGWFFTLLSTCLCVLGCFIIYIDDIYVLLVPRFITKRFPFEIRDNYAFMNASLSFSAGCLTFTALYRLLPEAKEYLRKSCDLDSSGRCANYKQLSLYLFIAYAVGMFVCLALNSILHVLTSKSVVHCNHSGHKHSHDASDTDTIDTVESTQSHSHSHAHTQDTASGHSHAHHHDGTAAHHDGVDGETRPLLLKKQKSKPFLHYITNSDEVGECKGYSSADVYLFNNPGPQAGARYNDVRNPTSPLDMPQANTPAKILRVCDDDQDLEEALNHTHHPEAAHHHHVSTPLSHLLLIGIETSMAITLHKFPEGFITYITSETNRTLGLLIFLSLMFHNFTEGLLMCLPLYYLMSASGSKWAKLKAFSISSVLGGFSQPLGALCGAAFLAYNEKESIDLQHLNYIFGITMSVTSGFLTVIGLQMFSSAISFNRGSLNFVLMWCLAGMCVIGFSSVLTAK